MFKAEYRRRNPGADVDKLTDEDLLREVMNTVGKPGRLGGECALRGQRRDADRGLGRQHRHPHPGYSRVPLPTAVRAGRRPRPAPPLLRRQRGGHLRPRVRQRLRHPVRLHPLRQANQDPPPRCRRRSRCAAVPGREHYRITFPKLDGYRLEIPDADLWLDLDELLAGSVIGPGTVPTKVEVAGIVGKTRPSRDRILAHGPPAAGRVRGGPPPAGHALLRHRARTGARGSSRAWSASCRDWLDECVDVADGFAVGYLMYSTERQAEAVEAIYAAIAHQEGNRRERLRPILRRFDPVGSTGDVRFLTRKALVATEKSEVSHVTLDGQGGNTWEQILAAECELSKYVAAYVKNDHLGLTIPYVHKGRTHAYVPDFLLRLTPRDGDVQRTLIVEVSGGQKSPGPTATKAATARDSWCAAVNNHGGFGRWGYLEVTTMAGVRETLAEAIDNLYADRAIIGDPDLLDIPRVG